jgi:hypothetical protein
MDEDSDAFYADEDDEEDAESDVMLEGDDEDDEVAFDAAGDEAFSHDPSGKGKRKAHEVEFTCLDLAAIQQQQKKEVDHVAGMFVVRVSRSEDILPSVLAAYIPFPALLCLPLGHRRSHSAAPLRLEQGATHRTLHGRS